MSEVHLHIDCQYLTSLSNKFILKLRGYRPIKKTKNMVFGDIIYYVLNNIFSFTNILTVSILDIF